MWPKFEAYLLHLKIAYWIDSPSASTFNSNVNVSINLQTLSTGIRFGVWIYQIKNPQHVSAQPRQKYSSSITVNRRARNSANIQDINSLGTGWLFAGQLQLTIRWHCSGPRTLAAPSFSSFSPVTSFLWPTVYMNILLGDCKYRPETGGQLLAEIRFDNRPINKREDEDGFLIKRFLHFEARMRPAWGKSVSKSSSPRILRKMLRGRYLKFNVPIRFFRNNAVYTSTNVQLSRLSICYRLIGIHFVTT